MEKALVERADLPFTAIPASGLRGKNPLIATKAMWQLQQGYRQSCRIIRQFEPQALFVTGGYVCVPITLAARRYGIPILIYLPDIEPGLAIKSLARFATRVAVTAPDAQQFFKPGLTVVTGYPVRPELSHFAMMTPAEQIQQKAIARQQFGLRHDKPTVLIFGGSRGARSINMGISEELSAYLEVAQLLHVTGLLDADAVMTARQKLPPARQADYHVYPYLHDEMTAALIAADLVVSRAGASVLGEFPVVGLPAVLIPYPHAGAHQMVNATYLTRHNAAFLIPDVDIKLLLRDTVINVISDSVRLDDMRQATLALAQRDAAKHLAQQILEVGRHGD